MTQTNVIGPIDQPTWLSMRMLREAVKINKCKPLTEAREAEIEKDQECYYYFMNQFLTKQEEAA